MKFRKGIFLAVLTLVLMITSSAYAAGENVQGIENKDQKSAVSIQTAQIVGERFLQESGIENWNQSTLAYSETFYDLDETESAYYFLVNFDNKQNGYIVVSAIKERGPILQFGLGTLEFDKTKGSKGYFLGLQIIYSDSGSELLSKSVNIDNKSSEQNSGLRTLKKTPESSVPVWDKYLSSEKSITPMVVYPTSKELALTRVWQRTPGVNHPTTSCGPATAAMIVNYYNYVRGYSLKGSYYYFGDAAFINHLYTDLGTGSIGTSLSSAYTGLLTHLNHDYTLYFRGMSYNSGVGNYGVYKDAIMSNNPVAIRYNYFVSSDSYTNYHFVAGNGFKTVSGVDYFGVKDPDYGENYTATQWINWLTNDDDFGMILTFPQT
ncbi:hypothetical protein [Paenibacillus sp. FSL E2-0178]|uniref:hypothetical protein n=1 Tax=Paenibacillus sp. FSL E2-0178 TaxID=2921361 RepID=UPI0031585C58